MYVVYIYSLGSFIYFHLFFYNWVAVDRGEDRYAGSYIASLFGMWACLKNKIEMLWAIEVHVCFDSCDMHVVPTCTRGCMVYLSIAT